jgi:hypothetical protein
MATDSQGFSVSTPISIAVDSSELFKVSHTYTMSVRTDFTLFTYDIQHSIWWAGNLTQFFNQTSESIKLLNVTSSSGVAVVWSNNTINNKDPPYTCPIDLIYDDYNQLKSDSLKASLNQYQITSVTLSLRGVCEGVTTSTSTQKTTTSTSTISTTSSTTTTPPITSKLFPE